MAELSDKDRNILRRCADLIDRHGASGIFPRGFQHRQFLRLEKEGLLRYVGLGADIDGEDSSENHHIYEITETGRAALAAPAIPATAMQDGKKGDGK